MPSDGATVRLGGEHTRRIACKLIAEAPDGWVVKIGEEHRSLDQAAKFYALCSTLARSTLTWDGERQSKRAWHDLLVHAWMLATDRKARLLPGLNGGRVSLLLGTRDMTKSEMSELLDFTMAWATEHGVHVED
jgi:hypothetical protein